MCFVLSLDGVYRCLGWMGGSVTDPGAKEPGLIRIFHILLTTHPSLIVLLNKFML